MAWERLKIVYVGKKVWVESVSSGNQKEAYE
jgi:hypothetical protein